MWPTRCRKAWVRLDVPQCGYCQSGQIIAIIALLTENKSPNDADINSALSGNLCRCATYHRIRAAVHEAARNLAVIGETSMLTKFLGIGGRRHR